MEASPHQYPAGVQEFSSVLKLSTRDRIRFHRKRPPEWLSDKESACQCRRHRFDLWVRMIPWRREWLPTPVFLPGKFYGQRSLESHSPWDRKESDKAGYTHTHPRTHTHTAPRPTRSNSSADISRRSRLLPLLLDINQRFPQPSFQVQSTC